MPHILPGVMAVEYGINGIIAAPSLSSGAGFSALGQAYRLVKDGHQDVVIVAGLDFNVNDNAVGGMEAFGAVTTKITDPDQALRPFDS